MNTQSPKTPAERRIEALRAMYPGVPESIIVAMATGSLDDAAPEAPVILL